MQHITLKKRLLSLALCLCMVLTCLPVSARAEEAHDHSAAPVSEDSPQDTSANTATLNGTEYATFAEAYAAAANGDTITLTGDSTADCAIEKSITIELNGHSLEQAGSWLSIENAEVTIKGPGSLEKLLCSDDSTLTIEENPTIGNFNLFSTAIIRNAQVTGNLMLIGELMVYDGVFNVVQLQNYTQKATLYGGFYEAIYTLPVGPLPSPPLSDHVTLGENCEFSPAADLSASALYDVSVVRGYPVMIGENGYDTLSAALSAAATGDTITIRKNLTNTDSLTIPEGVTLTNAEGAVLTNTGTLRFTRFASCALTELTNTGTLEVNTRKGTTSPEWEKTIFFDHGLYLDGGDVTKTRILVDKDSVPTYYTAGEGYAIYDGKATDPTTDAEGNEVPGAMGTLYLNNATIQGVDCDAPNTKAIGVRLFMDNMRICFSGENSIFSGKMSKEAEQLCALDAKNLTLTGTGENPVLNVIGESNELSSSFGIACESLTITAGTVNATGGSAQNSGSNGVFVGGDLTVESGAVLNATGGLGQVSSGINLQTGTATIEGTVNAQAGQCIVSDEEQYGSMDMIFLLPDTTTPVLALGDDASLDALVAVVCYDEDGEMVVEITAYGDATLTGTLPVNGINATGYNADVIFSIPTGTSLTVASGATLDLRGMTKERIWVEGDLVVNGTILCDHDRQPSDCQHKATCSICGQTYGEHDLHGNKCTIEGCDYEAYDLWVGGKKVDTENASDVLGDGTVSYDQASKTLTLKGATITGKYQLGNDENYDFENSGICAFQDVTIVLEAGSENKLSNLKAGIYMDAEQLTIRGSGKLTVEECKELAYAASGNVTIEGGVINASTNMMNGIEAGTGLISVTGGDVTIVCAYGALHTQLKGISFTGGRVYLEARDSENAAVISEGDVNISGSVHLTALGMHNAFEGNGNVLCVGGYARTTQNGAFSTECDYGQRYFEYVGADHLTGAHIEGTDTHKVVCKCAEPVTVVDKEVCTLSKATCQKKATCSVCGEEYGELAEHVLDNSNKCTAEGCDYEFYNLWVGGKRVGSTNASDILGDGTASYDRATKTLTLNGADITGGALVGTGISEKHGIASMEALTVLLADGTTNTIIDGYGGITGAAGLTIQGTGALTVNGQNHCIASEKDFIHITGGRLDLTSDTGAGIAGGMGVAIVIGGNVHLTVDVSGRAINDEAEGVTITLGEGYSRSDPDDTFTQDHDYEGTYFEYVGKDHLTVFTSNDDGTHNAGCTCATSHIAIEQKCTLSKATCIHQATCSQCGWAEEGLGDHEDPDCDHDCDFCGEKISSCEDEDGDNYCDLCGKVIHGWERIAGDNRWETARKVADELKKELKTDKFKTILVASGESYPDAIVGGYLATVKGAPILLSCKNGKYDSLNLDNISYIRENLAEDGQVYILGGNDAVPDSYETRLEEYKISVKRLEGENRFETNVAILKEAGVQPGSEVLVCTGLNYADSLSASATGKPVLFVGVVNGKTYGMEDSTLEMLEGCSFTIIGGEDAVPEQIEDTLAAWGSKVERLVGDNRLETAMKVAEIYFMEERTPDEVLVVCGNDFPDGLCGGILGHAMGVPVLLVQKGYEGVVRHFLAGHAIQRCTVLGGETVVSDASADALIP